MAQISFNLPRRLMAEFSGTALLLAAITGSGIMGESLAGGNSAIALLANCMATGAILFVLITVLGPVSGAHFNPIVSLVSGLRLEVSARDVGLYIAAQIPGAFAGVFAAHLMFNQPIVQFSTHVRSGGAQWFSEGVAAFGLISTILLAGKLRAQAVPAAVALYIVSAYWFTASTSFANPAVTLARAFTDGFAGIRLIDVPWFALFQISGGLLAWAGCTWLLNAGDQE